MHNGPLGQYTNLLNLKQGKACHPRVLQGGKEGKGNVFYCT